MIITIALTQKNVTMAQCSYLVNAQIIGLHYLHILIVFENHPEVVEFKPTFAQPSLYT